MESGKFMFPVIEMQKFRESEMESSKKLREACEEFGVCRIANHGISPTLMSEMKEIARNLFDRPIEIKRRNVDVVPSSGYVGPSQNKPFYEALGFHGLDYMEAQINFCDQLNANPRERDIILKYSKAVSELIVETRIKLAKSLGVSGDDLFKGWPCQVKINKYDLTDQHLGLRTHTDSSFFTILQDDEDIEGLEMIRKDTGEFEAVHPWPGTFLLLIGDLGKAWSNGRFHSPIHRVRGKRAARRVSIVTYFFNPDDVAIEAPSELVDEEHPRLYLPLSYEGFRTLRLSKNMILGEALDLVRMPNTSNYIDA